MHELINDFKEQRTGLARRRRSRLLARFTLTGSVFGLAALVFASGLPSFITERLLKSADGQAIAVPAESQNAPGGEFSISDADEMRDPLFFAAPPEKAANKNKFAIRFQSASSATARTDGVFYVADKMIGASVQLMQALPGIPAGLCADGNGLG